MSTEQEGTQICGSETDKGCGQWETNLIAVQVTEITQMKSQQHVTGEWGGAPQKTTPACLCTLKGESSIISHILIQSKLKGGKT